jgi:hypothetical protein
MGITMSDGDTEERIEALVALLGQVCTPDTEEWRCGYRDGVETILRMMRGMEPSQDEVDGYCSEWELDSADYYQLCREDGKPLQHSPCVAMSYEDAEREHQRLEAEAGRAARYANRTCLWDCDREALETFASLYGRQWKRELRKAWKSGSAGPVLQPLAEHRCFGEAGLAKFKLRKALAT